MIEPDLLHVSSPGTCVAVVQGIVAHLPALVRQDNRPHRERMEAFHECSLGVEE